MVYRIPQSDPVGDALQNLATTFQNLPSRGEERLKTALTGLQVQEALTGIEGQKARTRMAEEKWNIEKPIADLELRRLQREEAALNTPINFSQWVQSIAQGDPETVMSRNAWGAKYLALVENTLGGKIREDGYMYLKDDTRVAPIHMQQAGPALAKIGTIITDPIEGLRNRAQQGDQQAAAMLKQIEADPQNAIDLYQNHHLMQLRFFGDLMGEVPPNVLGELRKDHLDWTKGQIEVLRKQIPTVKDTLEIKKLNKQILKIEKELKNQKGPEFEMVKELLPVAQEVLKGYIGRDLSDPEPDMNLVNWASSVVEHASQLAGGQPIEEGGPKGATIQEKAEALKQIKDEELREKILDKLETRMSSADYAALLAILGRPKEESRGIRKPKQIKRKAPGPMGLVEGRKVPRFAFQRGASQNYWDALRRLQPPQRGETKEILIPDILPPSMRLGPQEFSKRYGGMR